MSVDAQQIQDSPITDRIEKRIEVRAPRPRVWRAIATSSAEWDDAAERLKAFVEDEDHAGC